MKLRQAVKLLKSQRSVRHNRLQKAEARCWGSFLYLKETKRSDLLQTLVFELTKASDVFFLLQSVSTLVCGWKIVHSRFKKKGPVWEVVLNLEKPAVFKNVSYNNRGYIVEEQRWQLYPSLRPQGQRQLKRLKQCQRQ